MNDRVEYKCDSDGSAFTNVWLDGLHSRILHWLPEPLAFAAVRQARAKMAVRKYVQH